MNPNQINQIMLRKSPMPLVGYDDVAIQQEYSSVSHRGDVNLLDSDNFLPVWIAPMPGLVGLSNYRLFEDNHLHTILPRSFPLSERKFHSNHHWAAFGIKEILECTNYELKSMNFILLDIANGSTEEFFNTADLIKSINPDGQLMGGNIANPGLMDHYMEHGFDYVRVGIGGGSQCTTSILTGVHYPPISLISDCYNIRDSHSKRLMFSEVSQNFRYTKIIADGGVSNFGRVCKALVAGADAVMIGGMAAEIEECTGEIYTSHKTIVEVDSGRIVPIRYRDFYGASTRTAQEEFGKTRRERCHAEGIHSVVEIKYKLEEFISRLSQSLRSCATMIGANSIKEFKNGKLNWITASAYSNFNANKL